MTDTFNLKAPTGSELQGTYETIIGAADVSFSALDGSEFEHTGNGTEMFWDTATTKTIAGATVFMDRDGKDWLAHHLIPENAQPHGEVVMDAIDAEMRMGEKLEAARPIHDALKSDRSGDCSDETRAWAGHIFHRLHAAYDDAKAATMSALRAHPPVIEEEEG